MNVWSMWMKNDNFGLMIDYLSTFGGPSAKVKKSQFDEWQRQWVFDAVAGMRYGQSFCKYFNIATASPLYFFKDNKVSERWIRDNYIEK